MYFIKLCGNFKNCLNPNSIETLYNCKLEPSLSDVPLGFTCQFERLGYFCVDINNLNINSIVFNRIVTLRDTWAKLKNK